MNVFVTGGNGFIGKHLAAQCSTQGHEIVIVDRLPSQSEYKQYLLDASNVEDMKRILTELGQDTKF
jgi:nucleoside-diphosphate-sugar epimerase